MKSFKLLVIFLLLMLLFPLFLLASGKCPKCGKVWNQPWAKDFNACPNDGTPLVAIEKKYTDIDSEIIHTITVKRIQDKFKSYYRRKVALCVGINNYPDFPTLEYAVNDAQSMAGIFKGYGFDEVYLLTDSRSTKRKIVNELLRFKAESQKDDLFVFYFAGHGSTAIDHKGREQGYLIAVDSQGKNLVDTAISMGLFTDISETMPNKHLLFLVDSCYSGYGLTRGTVLTMRKKDDNINQYLDAITSNRAIQLLAAGGKNDLAHERHGHGIFTSYLLEVLEGKTHHKEDGVISALEMSSYIK